MIKRCIFHGLLFLLFARAVSAAAPETARAEQLPLFQKAAKADKERHDFAVSKGAKFLPTPDGKSFYIIWLPLSASPQKPPPVVFTLHGHGSWAFDEFFLWHPHIAEAGIGIIALQWWFGEGETPKDYYRPREIEKIMSSILRSQKIAGRTVLAHGFSRGSANIYGLTALDNRSEKFILLTVANAGKAGADFPINRDIASGVFGPRPFEGTLWVTYAGAKDPHPDRDGIPGMREAQDWIRRYGGTVKLVIEDEGDHGGFHRNPANVKKALEVFKQLLAEQAAR
jgi:hypothetical protein